MPSGVPPGTSSVGILPEVIHFTNVFCCFVFGFAPHRVNLYLFIFNCSWLTISHLLLVSGTWIRHLHTLLSDHPNESSHHLSPPLASVYQHSVDSGVGIAAGSLWDLGLRSHFRFLRGLLSRLRRERVLAQSTSIWPVLSRCWFSFFSPELEK